MGFKKYVRKQGRRLKAYAKKRYAPAGKVDFGKIASDVMKLKGIINSELKVKDDNNGVGITIPTQGAAWLWYRLNQLTAQDGADKGEREGMSVRFKSLQIRGRLYHNVPTSASTPRRGRMIIFIDKQPLVSGLAVAPVVTELLTGSTGTGSGHVNSMRNWDNIRTKRFTVLYDRVHYFDDEHTERTFKIYKKLNMVTTFQDGYTTGDAINKNAIYMVFISDVPTGSTELLAVDWQSRMTYYDN